MTLLFMYISICVYDVLVQFVFVCEFESVCTFSNSLSKIIAGFTLGKKRKKKKRNRTRFARNHFKRIHIHRRHYFFSSSFLSQYCRFYFPVFLCMCFSWENTRTYITLSLFLTDVDIYCIQIKRYDAVCPSASMCVGRHVTS